MARMTPSGSVAGAGAAGSFLAKLVIVVVVVLVLSAHRDTFDPVWFFATLAVGVLGVVGIESWTLAHARLPVVVPADSVAGGTGGAGGAVEGPTSPAPGVDVSENTDPQVQ